METENNPKDLTTNQKIANTTTTFFKAFKWSAIIAISVFIIFWVIVYQVPRPINPNDAGGSYNHFQRLCQHAYGEIYDPVVALSQASMNRIKRTWVADKTRDSFLFSLIAFIGIPVLCIAFKGISNAKKWVEENKTI
jgi:uncharacterized membrane protein SpoIIM required for sporulation